jgi:hypothetical protein
MEYDKMDFLESLLKGECKQREIKAVREDSKGKMVLEKFR